MILLTGGAGYIGSHMLLELLEANYEVVVLDNLSNSSIEPIHRVERLVGKKCLFIEGDITNKVCLDSVFNNYPIQAVLHFAGLKAVGESVDNPLIYFEHNIVGSLFLLQAMQKANVKRIVFSSSATVYGEPDEMPVTEESPTSMPASPYGYTKLAIEHSMMQVGASDPEWSIAVLRYFNPIGAHSSGQIGEDPQGTPNNLLPYIAQVAIGRRKQLSIFGSDYATHDGTGVRDYIHVVDLVKGHLAALDFISQSSGYHIWNLGTGQGYSVLDIIKAFEKANSIKIPYELVSRRAGDIAAYYADPSKASKELHWQAQLSLDDMMVDTWRWQSNNPQGYH